MLNKGLRVRLGTDGIASAFFLVAFFLVVSMPSLKLLYSSEALNFAPVALYCLGFILSPRIVIDRKKAIILLSWFVFSFVFLMIDLIYGVDSSEGVFRYLYLLLIVGFAILFSSEDIARRLPLLLMGWGWFVSFWQVAVGVVYVRALGQTYLTVALPIGVSLCISMIYLLRGNVGFYYRALLLAGALLCVLAISALRVRGILIYSGIAVFLFVVFGSILNKELGTGRKVWSLAIFGGLLFSFLTYVFPKLEFTQLYRFEQLLDNPEEESRVGIYLKSLEYILDNPVFGVGASTIEREIGIYPHNILLEVLLSVGIVGGVSFFLLMFYWMKDLAVVLRHGETMKHLIGIAAASVVLFLQWNTSFDLATAYIPLSAMVLFMCGRDEFLTKGERCE